MNDEPKTALDLMNDIKEDEKMDPPGHRKGRAVWADRIRTKRARLAVIPADAPEQIAALKVKLNELKDTLTHAISCLNAGCDSCHNGGTERCGLAEFYEAAGELVPEKRV